VLHGRLRNVPNLCMLNPIIGSDACGGHSLSTVS
jgi:hypothetical protein